MRTSRFVLAVLALAASALGCSDLRPNGDPDVGPRDAISADGSIPAQSGAFRHESGEGGVVTTFVDASSLTDSVYLDLETGLATDVDGPWDIAFRRYFVTTNGGVSGDDGGAATRVPGTTFDALVLAPETGWREDLPDTDDDRDNGPDTAFNGGPDGLDDWYDYDPATHVLSARDVAFAVRSGAGGFFAIQMLGYYDMTGTPALPSFRWKRIEGGPIRVADAGPIVPRDAGVDASVPIVVPDDAITIDASDREVWIYYDLQTSSVMEVADPTTSTTWDLAFRRAAIRTNSGSSGPALGGARATEESEPDAVTSTGTLGFVADELETEVMPGTEPSSHNPIVGDWFLYDFATHTLSARTVVYVVRTGDGGYARVRVWTWEEGVYEVSIAPIDRVVETVTLAVDASSASVWTYVDLATGTVLSGVTAPATDTTWDLALRRTEVATSSGTSGAGTGGALDTTRTDLASVTEIPTSGFVVDAELALPGPPGAGTYSGNPALATWYDYDEATHVVSPRATTFLVRLADGSSGKLAVRSWTDGTYGLDWAYAGPNRDAF